MFDLVSITTEAEDIQEIDKKSEIWINFTSYINELYEDDLMFFTNIKSSGKEECHKQDLDAPIYKKESTSSSNNFQNESCSKTKISIKTNESKLNLTGITTTKEIPGGRYGLTQFIKYYGPFEYKKMSYGKLSKLVQMVIEEGILRYNSTYLVKASTVHTNTNTKISEISKNDDLEIQKKIQKIREKLIEALLENKNYIPLAQVKAMLTKKLDFKLDLEELGFKKLRKMIEYFSSEINLESLGDNHFYIELKREVYEENKQ